MGDVQHFKSDEWILLLGLPLGVPEEHLYIPSGVSVINQLDARELGLQGLIFSK
jgi:hypothetical protein